MPDQDEPTGWDYVEFGLTLAAVVIVGAVLTIAAGVLIGLFLGTASWVIGLF